VKPCSAVWAGIVALCLVASSCASRTTPASTPSSQTQPTPEIAAQPSSFPAAEQGKAPPPKEAAREKKTLSGQPTTSPSTQTTSPTPPPQPVILPAGTLLTVRVNKTVGSSTSKSGDKFTASLAEPVVYKGQTVIPSRSAVAGVISQAQQGGKIKGSSSLTLKLVSLTVKGLQYPISTGSFVQEGKGKGGRTAKYGAGGAAAGAVVGGIAGGGKGALIGSAVGAGAGVAGSAFTGNKELTIPAETVLRFRLAQSLRLNPDQSPQPTHDPTQP
jgi:hypothetical protein